MNEKLLRQKTLNKLKNEIMRELQLYSYKPGENTGEHVAVSDVNKAISSILFKDQKEEE